MTSILIRKLELFGRLPEVDRHLIEEAVSQPQAVDAHVDLVREGEAPGSIRLVVDGFACRYKLLPSGSRQIFAYLIPGDFCDLHVFILKAMDHSIATLSPCTIVHLPKARILELFSRPLIARALWWATLVEEATLREWLVNLGSRDATEGIAHLFCELHLRLASIGLTSEGHFQLPITQTELGDTLGLSTVHVNRTLQILRARGLISFKSKRLVILNVPELRKISGFNPNYLHLEEAAGVAGR